MILKKVKMEPFGGVSRRELEFKPGLNVVVGANEAGKSTLVNAVFSLLFIPSQLSRGSKDWKGYLSRFLPLGGGDMLSVTAEFSSGNEDYSLTRIWGEGRSCRLVTGQGAVVTREETATGILAEILRHGRGTYEHVLFARQEEMLQTVELLRANSEAANTLADALRATLFQAGGVSLDELAKGLAESKAALLNNWDVALDGPRNNRGIDNPHKKSVGDVLAAYYEVEKLKRAVRASRDAEQRLEQIMAELSKTLARQEVVDSQKKAMEKVESDVHKRATLEPELRALAPQEEKLKRVNVEWPAKTERLKHLAERQQKEKKRLAELDCELKAAIEAAQAKKIRERYQALQPLAAELVRLEGELAGLPAVSEEEVSWLAKKQALIAKREAELQAMKLQASLVVTEPLQLSVTSGLQEASTVAVEKEMDFTGEGLLRLSTDKWTLSIQSGMEDVETILTDIRQAKEDCTSKLQSLGCEDLEEVKKVQLQRNHLAGTLSQVQAKMEVLLQGEPFAQLETAASSLPVEEPLRDTDAIHSERAQVLAESKAVENELAGLQEQVRAWEEEFSSFDAVMDHLVELKAKGREIEKGLVGLAGLPEGYNDAGEFLAALQALRRQSEEMAEAALAQQIALSEAQKDLSELTAEELSEKLQLAQHRLDRLKQEAEALLRVEQEFNELAATLDQNTFDPFVASFCRYLSPATGFRYQAASLDGALPTEIAAADGKTLPVELLSTGTTRGIALALRLSMAEYLLGDAQGFMVMDDPLVDLDPQRKEHASAMLREYAQEKQLIITTCDPQTAQLLAGNCIELS